MPHGALSNTTVVHAALRESTAALMAGQQADDASNTLSGPECITLAADLADNLDALVQLLDTSGIEPIPGHLMRALVRQLSDSAAIAHRASGAEGTSGVTSPTTIPGPAPIPD